MSLRFGMAETSLLSRDRRRPFDLAGGTLPHPFLAAAQSPRKRSTFRLRRCRRRQNGDRDGVGGGPPCDRLW